MDLETQEQIKNLADEHGKDQVLVVLGAPDAEAAEIAAETIVEGDPTYAGALTEAQLGLDVYHILDDEISQAVPDDVWDDQIGVMADVLEADELVSAVAGIRAQSPRSPAD